jgi:hypothetical protein
LFGSGPRIQRKTSLKAQFDQSLAKATQSLSGPSQARHGLCVTAPLSCLAFSLFSGYLKLKVRPAQIERSPETISRLASGCCSSTVLASLFG